jgi:hypothetical protein
LVASAFLGVGTRVLHGEGGIHDNRPVNLRYGTQYDNMQDKKRDGTAPTGSRNPFAKLTEDDVRELRRDWPEGVWRTYKEAAVYFGVSENTIGPIVRGETWTHVR